MNLHELKIQIKQCGVLYLTTIVILFVLKLWYRQADSNDLQWILAPTAWWVRALGGISFENVPHVGYVSHELRFIIARSCSGFQFMLIAAAALIFSFLHRVASLEKLPFKKEKCDPVWRFGWIIASFGISYVLTILVNSLRIILAIYLPLFLEQAALSQGCSFYDSFLTSDSLHTLIGTVVYFASLLVIYRTMDELTLRIFNQNTSSVPNANSADPYPVPAKSLSAGNRPGSLHRFLKPAFWYFFFVLGVPVLNRAWQNGAEQFAGYAVLVSAACLVILTLFSLPEAVWKRIERHNYRL